MIPLPERIHQIVTGHTGIKASRLCAQLATEYLNLTGKEIRMTLITMIANKEVVEIEYTLPNGKNDAIILEKGSEFKGVN